MTYWLKVGYFKGARDDADYWLGRSWISDSPGRVSPWWDRKPRPAVGDVYPPHGPRYEIGDELVIYVTGGSQCVAIMEVVGEPEWDPGWVDDNAIAGEGDQWGVVTEVRGKWALDRGAAPTIEKIGRKRTSVQRKGHVELSAKEFERAKALISDGTPAKRSGRVVRMPIEDGVVDEYQITASTRTRDARRREHRLVSDYREFMEAKGDLIHRWRAMVGGRERVVCDLVNETRNHIVEAKTEPTRADVRLAIGQLADYRRFAERRAKPAVLVGSKPSADLLALLQSQGIASIWRHGRRFTDDADGEFTL